MGFETVMLSVVKDVVRHSQAEFQYGTLFVSNINEGEANRILNNLRNYTTFGIQMNEGVYEFSYDFVDKPRN